MDDFRLIGEFLRQLLVSLATKKHGEICFPIELYSRQVVSEKSRRLQREKKVSESANPDTQLIHCQNFINNTYSSLKSTKSFFRISDTMTFCRENLMNNSEIGEVVRKLSCEPKNCFVTRATGVSLVEYCLGNPNLVSEFFSHDAEKRCKTNRAMFS